MSTPTESESLAVAVAALKSIAALAGNLPDEQLESRTGANDAVARGILVTGARAIAKNALAQIPTTP